MTDTRLGGTDLDIEAALLEIGKHRTSEQHDIVAPFLSHPASGVRRAALMAVAFYWRLPEYREFARNAAFEDPDDEIRASAIGWWALYYADSAEKSVLEALMRVVLDRSLNQWIRESAFYGLLSVLGYPRQRAPKPWLTTNSDFDREAPWRTLAEALETREISLPPELEALMDASHPRSSP